MEKNCKEFCSPEQRNMIKAIARFKFQWAESSIYEKILEWAQCSLPEGIEEIHLPKKKTDKLIESLSKHEAHIVISKLLKLEKRNEVKPYIPNKPGRTQLREAVRTKTELIF